LARLAGHNSSRTNESNPTRPTCDRSAPKHYGYYSVLQDNVDSSSSYLCTNADEGLPDDFEVIFHQFELPVWNDDHKCFESTPELESDNPFANRFLLQPDHPSYVAFNNQQKATSNEKDVGYYAILGAYLGYKPTETPKIHLHMISVPPKLLFNKASVHDPNTLIWEQAMSEEPNNVKKWLDAADKEIRQLDGKETWDEVPLYTSTVKVIPGTWVFCSKRSPNGTFTKWKA
jgi:hypothetical protein